MKAQKAILVLLVVSMKGCLLISLSGCYGGGDSAELAMGRFSASTQTDLEESYAGNVVIEGVTPFWDPTLRLTLTPEGNQVVASIGGTASG